MVLRTKPVYRKSMMNRLLNWMGLVDEGEPGLKPGIRAPVRDDQPPATAAEPVPYCR